jgi:hypothetical protein
LLQEAIIMRHFAVALGFSGLLIGPALADPAMTSAATTMRAKPSAKGAVVQSIPANAQIDVSNCGAAWCYGSWRNRFGYVSARAVAPAGGPPPDVAYGPGPIYPPAYGWSYGWGWGWGPGYGWRY